MRLFELFPHTEYTPHIEREKGEERQKDSFLEKKVILGLDQRNPAFGWKIIAGKDESNRLHSNIKQGAYHLIVLDEKGEEVWSSGVVETDRSHGIAYPQDAPELQSSKRYSWQVRVWNQDGTYSAVSERVEFEMGLLDNEDWQTA